jgi:glycine/D-amino acid oxidase-like deaminating enzyme
MPTSYIYDYLIIGQGLAGTLLSYHLIKHNQRVCVISTTDRTTSSYVAAGILAPITGPRLAKTFHDDAQYAYACQLYLELERDLSCSIYRPMPYLRILNEASIRNYAAQRLADDAYKRYLAPAQAQHEDRTYDAVSIMHAAHIDTTVLLDAYRSWLQQQDAYVEATFDEEAVQLDDTIITYKGIRSRNIVYCTGLAAGTSRFFPQLQFNPTKGEILTIETTCSFDAIYGVNTIFILPIGNNRYHIGATYERNFVNTKPSAVARQQLLHAFEAFCSQPYTIVAHQAGIRPTTFGHHPYSFWHAAHPNIGIFTGFGSKGLSLIPAYARDLIARRAL